MDQELHRSIMKTLAYFDTFDFPLTAEEIYRWLWAYPSTVNRNIVRLALVELVESMDISERDSYYCLLNRKHIIRFRQNATSIVKEKMAIARKAAKILSFIPYVRAMFVCNTVAGAVPHEKSDIDAFIIIRPGRMWFARACIAAVLSLTSLRRTKTNIHNRICLSFFITEDRLDLADITWGMPDIYLAYWIDQLVPVFDPDNILRKIHEKNTWVKSWLPHALSANAGHPRWMIKKQQRVRLFFEYFLNGRLGKGMENVLRDWQRKKMDRNVGSLQHAHDSRVVINDSMLKFHENDRREFFRQRWKNKCFELNI